MQFIDFKKEHFTLNEDTNDYFLEISKEEIGYGEITILEKENDELYGKAQCDMIDDLDKITIKMKKPADIRVNF